MKRNYLKIISRCAAPYVVFEIGISTSILQLCCFILCLKYADCHNIDR